MIAHICNNFISSRVHTELVTAIANKGVAAQCVFVPVRRRGDIGQNDLNLSSVQVGYVHCHVPFLKYFPLLKVFLSFFCFRRYLREIESPQLQHVLAHTLWSDGCVAFLNYLLSRVPYTVVVRGTDINLFLPKLPHYRWLIKLILRHAVKIIFVSPAHQRRFSAEYSSMGFLTTATELVPNGISAYWHKNRQSEQSIERDLSVLFVGRFDFNKNISGLIKAVELARKSSFDLKLSLVGGSKDELVACTGLHTVPEWVIIKERISDQFELREYYRQARVFMLVSFSETFGLVCIEALSQGCPFIYTKNEGVSGLFDGAPFAIGVHPNDHKAMAEALITLATRFPAGLSPDISIKVSKFNWGEIADRYLEIMLGKTGFVSDGFH